MAAVMMPGVVRLRLTQIVLWTGIFATLAIFPFTNFDPISLPKMAIIVVGGVAAVFILFSYSKELFELHKSLILLSGLFAVALLLTFLFSDAPLKQQLWGMFGRNTGLLAYLSLLFILLASCVGASMNFDFPMRLSLSVLFVSCVETIYCLIQIAKKDPIRWSEMQPFGTLGNVNFLSAFLGLSSVIILSMLVSKSLQVFQRIMLLVILITQLFIILKTGSIQGIMMFGVGSGIVTLLFTASKNYLKLSSLLIVVSYGTVGTLAGFALFDRGPLARFIFQPSITFRWDYMHAAVEMFTHFPLVGVGLDSYGDWYREMRGQISTLRTGPDRVSNSAHNIFLDIASNGGILLISVYLLFIVWALMGCLKIWQASRMSFNPWETALVAAWVSYQVQALISINQLGVGVWAWIMTGVLIAYAAKREDEAIDEPRLFTQSNKKTQKISNHRRKLKGELIPARVSLMGIFGACIGVSLVVPPLQADSKVYDAIQSKDFMTMTQSLEGLGTTAWHMEVALDNAVRNNDVNSASQIIDLIQRQFPRDYYAHFIQYVSANSSETVREIARQKLRELDPFNPNVP